MTPIILTKDMRETVSRSIRTCSRPWRLWRCELQGVDYWRGARAESRWQGGRRRHVSTTSREWGHREIFEVDCASSGRITVDVYNSQGLYDPSFPLVIYLPPTGTHLRETQPPIPSFLERLPFQATIARINYRWNLPPPLEQSPDDQTSASLSIPLSSSLSYHNYPFPTPLHDTFAAYDFLTTTYLPSFDCAPPLSSPYTSPPSTLSRKRPQRPVIISGTFLGGTLATSLALTSTYTNNKHEQFRIAGLITENAVFDWTHISVLSSPTNTTEFESQNNANEEAAETRNTNSSRQDDEFSVTKMNHTSNWTPQNLHHLKMQLFASPQSAFDHFASPILFFRTSGFGVPQKWPGTESSAETNRFSTSISEEEHGVSSEFIDEDVAGDGERGEPEIVGAGAPRLATNDAEAAVEEGVVTKKAKKAKARADEGPELARVSYLKFPPTAMPTSSTSFSRYSGSAPTQPQLQIPRSLFLYSSQTSPSLGPSPSSNSPPRTAIRASKASKSKSKSKHSTTGGGEEDITPEMQAKEMARLMRRSVLMFECKERTMWDEGFDAHGFAGERVGVVDLDLEGKTAGENGLEKGSEGAEGVDERDASEKLRDWFEECLE